MATRTTKKTVIFTNCFFLREFEEALPAGIYEVDTQEGLLEGLSFLAYRRTSTVIHLHPKPGQPGIRQTLTIDPKELDAALQRDEAP